MTQKHIASVTAFAGKGGVGKTTCAAAAALYSASEGRKTLAISTDATPSLAHIFELQANPGPNRVADNLYFQEIGQQEAGRMWEDRFGRDVYQVFSSLVDLDYPEYVEFMTSVLPGLAEEFTVDYIRQLAEGGRYESIVWDTAPLGQTLALLNTPALLTKHLRMAPRIYTRLKAGKGTKEPILDIIRRWETLSSSDMHFLRTGVVFNIVAILEALAVEQLESIFSQMKEHNFQMGRLIVNNVVRSADSPFLREKSAQQQSYLKTIRGRYASLPLTEIPLLPHEVKGMTRIKEIASALFG